MAQFSDIVLNTTAQRLETIANMDIDNGVIDENSNDGSLPTSKAVYEAIKNIEVSGGGGIVDQTYDPESENAQSGIAVEQALNAYPYTPQFMGGVMGLVQSNGYTTTEQVEHMFNVLSQVQINENKTSKLETNKVYRFDIADSIAFELPTDIDTAILNSIELQVTISNYENITIDLGATKYFGDIPELSDGYYIIYYEHNGQDWCVGALEIVGA